MKITGLFTFLFFLTNLLNGQSDSARIISGGTIFGKIFFNYHYHFKDNEKGLGSFELTRGLLGYEHRLNDKISAVVAGDVMSTSSSIYTLYLKCAHIDWQVVKPIRISVGIIDLTQFNTQEKHWGYRYILKSFQDEYGYGVSNDIGVISEIKFHKKIKGNIFVVNGEGNKKSQDAFSMHRFGGNIIAEPYKGLVLKIYGDYYPNRFLASGNDGQQAVTDTSAINIISAFAGYTFKHRFRIGAEYNVMNNAECYSKVAGDYQLSGCSFYATYILSKKWEVFTRYDKLWSNKPNQSAEPWNKNGDGELIITGVQYTHENGFNMSLNYRSWIYSEIDSELSFLFLNLNYSF